MKIIAIIGKTASGKDTIAKYVWEKYGIQPIVSYTTRDIRPSETDGIEHWFVTKERMQELLKEGGIIAYSKSPKTGIEYCATESSLSGQNAAIYIINPNGLRELRKTRPDIEIISIYVRLKESTIIKRAKARGDSDDTILARLDSERDEFDSFYVSGEFDACIETKKSLKRVFSDVDKVLANFGFETVSDTICSGMEGE